ncbi:hypothetical protein H5410_024162 [Solanum commersonii]|uniref:RNase H type-1 domain-containing protein n=1 Tax=Solanum commersonii TaxID=4109 RepID=A0A9J5ZL60_SOLCO|nr:hypothetical protein H5410_024162 [Solanum commersonii]
MQIKHCFREGNQVADCLAKLASSSHQMLITQLYSNLPRRAKGLFLLDKWQLPNGTIVVFVSLRISVVLRSGLALL